MIVSGSAESRCAVLSFPRRARSRASSSVAGVARVRFMKTFQHEWVLREFDEHPTFRTKGMFGGLAVYLFERQMMLLVEPTKSGRWNWHGVLVCTEYENHASIQAEFPAFMPHEVLKKWLFIDSTHEEFESTMEAVARRIAKNDLRFGIFSKRGKPKKSKPPKK
jgi:hypothetical protein